MGTFTTGDVDRLVRDTLDAVRALERADTPSIRRIRRQLSARIRAAEPPEVLALAYGLIRAGLDWVGWELVSADRHTLERLTIRDLRALGSGIASWGQADAFGTIIAGPAWLGGQVSDDDVEEWARSGDRWWRRISLVATTVLNTKSRGGSGDTRRTLRIADMLAPDDDDMVVKALSWALRALAPQDPEAVRGYLQANETILAARVKREVRNKLETGRKTRTPAGHHSPAAT
jgi:DNA alkylation repair enzyme